MMRWFGRAYGAPYEADCEHIPTPVGVACLWCSEPIAEGDDGVTAGVLDTATMTAPREVPQHYECHLRAIVGGVMHQLGRCTCCGGPDGLAPDPEGMTKREGARAAVALYDLLRGAPDRELARLMAEQHLRDLGRL